MRHLLLLLAFLAPFLAAGEAAPPARKVKAITATATWVGNTFSGNNEARSNRGLAGGDIGDSTHVQHMIEDMFVRGDGTVVLHSHWDEAHHEAGIYKDGKLLGYCRETGGGRGGWDVTADESYIYLGVAVDWSFKKRGIARHDWTGGMVTFKGAAGPNRLPITAGATKGMACWKGQIFASDPAGKRVVVVDTASMKVEREFPLENPGRIAVDPRNGTLWITLAKTADKAAVIVHRAADGGELPGTIGDLADPQGMAFNPKDGLLAVVENGPDQQIVFYDVSGTQPKRIKTFGVKGGAMAGPKPGLAGPDRLWGPRGVGFDAEGRLYVGCVGFNQGGTDLRAYDAAGKLRWQLQGLMFVDCASLDPGDEDSLYSTEERFAIDWSKPPGQDWKLAAYTLNPFKHPEDPRGGDTAVMTRIAGKRILYTLDQNGSQIGIFRFDGEVAVPCGLFTATGKHRTSPSGRCMWYDRNNDQQMQADEWTVLGTERDCILGRPDSAGGLWTAGWGNKVRYVPCRGLDANGAPIYQKEDFQQWETPAPFTNADRVFYVPDSDTLYISGNTAEKPRTFGEDKHFITGGRVLGRVDGWLKGKRTVAWTTNVPRYDANHCMKSFAVAGDLVFGVEMQTSIIQVWDAASGVLIQELVPGPELGPIANHVWVDIPYAIQAHQRKNGEYVVVMEDDVYGKNVLWRITATE